MLKAKRSAIRLVTLLIALLMMLSSAAFAEPAVGFMPTREVDGRIYTARPPADLTAVLLIGYDHYDEGREVEQTKYSQGGQSDFLLLLVLDHENREIRQLQLDRDTMTGIKVYGVLGGYLGVRNMQLCLSHAYGDTQEKNNDNAVWAVENLLGIADENDGAGIDWYMAMDISGIAKLNDALGGVTVRIDDDFSAVDETMVQGTTMRLSGKQAEYYCRGRFYIGEQTNSSRMARQRRYLNAAADVFKAEVRRDANYARRLLNEMGVIYATTAELDDGFGFTTSDNAGTPVGEHGKYVMTNETLDSIVGQIARAIDYDICPIENLSGTHILARDGHIQYHLDEGVAQVWALSVFYDLAP